MLVVVIRVVEMVVVAVVETTAMVGEKECSGGGNVCGADVGVDSCYGGA